MGARIVFGVMAIVFLIFTIIVIYAVKKEGRKKGDILGIILMSAIVIALSAFAIFL